MQDIERYKTLLDAKERNETIDSVRGGIDSMKVGAGKSSESFFKEFFSKHHIAQE